MRTFSVTLAAFVATALIYEARCAAAQFYSLGVDTANLASGVSPDGSLVVTTRSVWTPQTGHISFPASEVWSRDISNNGVAAGLFCGGTGTCYEAFRWTAETGIQGLGSLPGIPPWGDSSDAYAISADGSVLVGYSSSAEGNQPFRWTAETGMIGLGHLGMNTDGTSAAWGVSADGSVITGVSQSTSGVEAFRWMAAGGMVGLGDLAGGEFHSEARAISSDGHVIVGQSKGAAGMEAFRWTAASGMLGLGDLPGGDFLSTAWAATADGQIVVGESSTSPLTLEAFIWDGVHGMRRLYDVLATRHGLGDALAGWSLTSVSDISDDGRVLVGYGFNPDGDIAGFAVVIPEPPAVAIALLATLAILLAKRIFRALLAGRLTILR